MARDPVCGMSVDPATSPHHSAYKGTEYYFCCKGCLDKFSKDPERYLAAPAPASPAPAVLAIGGLSKRAAGHGAPPAPAHPAPGTQHPAPQGTRYTCPMHPEVISDRPGACPKCGMALEPILTGATADLDQPNPELLDMNRRFRVAVALGAPVFLA